MSRKTVQNHPHRVSPLTGKRYTPIIQTDYSSEDSLAKQLAEKNAGVVICTFIMDSDPVCDAELRLNPRRRPPEKKHHLVARRELEKTSALEYAYLYPGMFTDYFGLPRAPSSSLRPLRFFVEAGGAARGRGGADEHDAHDGRRAAPGGRARAGRVVASTVSLNELVGLYGEALRRKLDVRYLPVETWLRHATLDLPADVHIAKEYPEGAGVALGAFDFGTWDQRQHLDLVKALEGEGPGTEAHRGVDRGGVEAGTQLVME
ncbi:hypothetical protein F5X96DRAFT_670342 [Biscogniauxia mediterranea]|nr:hypothetical protein F5X96DRAFT_670342 [Biscogniauxia mediterranea]